MTDGPISGVLESGEDYSRTPPISAAAEPVARRLANLAAASNTDFAAAWLHCVCAALVGAHAAILLVPGAVGLQTDATWPPAQPSLAELKRVAERAAAIPRPIIAWRRRDEKGAMDLLIGLSFELRGMLAAAVAVAISVPDGIDSVNPEAFADQLYLGFGWLDARLSRHSADGAAARVERASAAMDIVATASLQRRPARAAAVVVNELAVRFRCDRVSLGLTRRGGGIRLTALSHAASFEERNRVVDAIENAMEECLAQAAPVAYPPTAVARICVAHRDLAALAPAATAAASVVMPGPEGAVGVLTFERHGEGRFNIDTLLLAEAVGAVLGPVLHMQVAGDRLIAGRLVDWAGDAITALCGRDRPSLKLIALAIVATIVVLCTATGTYRVTARAVLEGEVQRAAVAPFDGFVASSAVRPGDRLRAGDVLAEMDDRDLVLERVRAWADAEKSREKYNEAMAKHDRPSMAILSAQIAQAEADLALTENKLARATITTPIDGLLVSGDLTQMLGTPLERGKVLFEIAPLDQYRIALRVDEMDMRFVSPGEHGRLSLAGLPSAARDFIVSRITPIAEAKDGRNEFRVEGTLTGPPGPDLRPGMEGVGKIDAGPHHLLWIWSHGIIDWLRLTAWKWLP